MNFTNIKDKFISVEEKLKFPMELVKNPETTITGKEKITDLEIGKQYFMKDHEGFTEYYVVVRETETKLTLLPIWHMDNTEDLYSGEVKDDLVLVYILDITEDTLEKIAGSLYTYDWNMPEFKNLTVDDYWLVCADEWNLLDYKDDKEMQDLVEKTYCVVYKTK